MKKILALSFLVAAFGVACSSTPKDPGVAGVNPAHPEERLPAADTDTDLLVEGGRVNLDKCGGRDGYAFMKRESNGQLVVYADNLECAYYQTPFSGGHQKLNGSQGRFNMRFVVDESAPGWHELVLGSKNYFTERTAGAKADIVRFYVPPRVVTLDLFWGSSQTYEKQLKGCHGYVKATRNGDQVNMIIEDIKLCNMFDIVGSNGESVDYNAKPIPNVGFGKNSFTLPKRVINFGRNGIEIRLYRAGSKQYGDRVLLRFNDWNW